MSTTLPYLSNSGNRSSAVVPDNINQIIHTYIHIYIHKQTETMRGREVVELTEGDVEDEKRVCVGDVWRARPAEVRHLLQRELGFAVQKEIERTFLKIILLGLFI